MPAPRLRVARPGDSLPAAYFAARYAVLREPLGFARGAERLPDDDAALHAWCEAADGAVVAVGRMHLIPPGSCGGCPDHAGGGAVQCPDFAPLGAPGLRDDAGCAFPAPEALRPAVQVRQMGTRAAYRRRGLAARMQAALEAAASDEWGARTGWLQARRAALPFYAAQGWVACGPRYEVPRIGPHRSMWKRLGTTWTDSGEAAAP